MPDAGRIGEGRVPEVRAVGAEDAGVAELVTDGGRLGGDAEDVRLAEHLGQRGEVAAQQQVVVQAVIEQQSRGGDLLETVPDELGQVVADEPRVGAVAVQSGQVARDRRLRGGAGSVVVAELEQAQAEVEAVPVAAERGEPSPHSTRGHQQLDRRPRARQQVRGDERGDRAADDHDAAVSRHRRPRR